MADTVAQASEVRAMEESRSRSPRWGLFERSEERAASAPASNASVDEVMQEIEEFEEDATMADPVSARDDDVLSFGDDAYSDDAMVEDVGPVSLREQAASMPRAVWN